WRGVTVVQAGDVAGADRCLETLRALTDRLGQPRLRFVLGTQEAWRAQLGGRLEEAERLADAASARGMEAGEPDALSLYAAQIGSTRWQQGRLHERGDLLAPTVDAAPRVAGCCAAAAEAALTSALGSCLPKARRPPAGWDCPHWSAGRTERRYRPFDTRRRRVEPGKPGVRGSVKCPRHGGRSSSVFLSRSGGAVSSGIFGVGAALPDEVVANAAFVDRLDTSDEWIVRRTGIHERRWLNGTRS